ncbi:MAG: hypothetical protein V3S21_09380 [Xanthomonadales bacterium]
MFKLMRVVVLLSILLVLVVGSWMTDKRLASWERPAWVIVYPIVADDAAQTLDYAQSVDESTFAAANQFMARESILYGNRVTPAFYIRVAQVSTELPPELPDQDSLAAIAWWSLKMRWWAWKMDLNDDLAGTDIQMFVLYHGMEGRTEVAISVGMRKGRYGVVNAYADESMNPRNLVVFTHELMHVFGASDKYIRATGEPEYPFGFADPNQLPLFPQKHAEIMGGRIPLSSFASEMPPSLEQCKIGRRTAEEIGLLARLMD